MARSVWKGPFFDGYLMKKVDAARANPFVCMVIRRTPCTSPGRCGSGSSRTASN